MQGSGRSLTALYIDRSANAAPGEEIQKNLALAQSYGASIEIINSSFLYNSKCKG